MPANAKETITKLFGGIIGLVVIGLLLSWGMSAQKKKEAKYPWRGSVYNVANDASTIHDTEQFKTVDECRTWANRRASDLSLNTSTWGFVCGTDCTWKENSVTSGRQIKQYECTEVVTE
jgi:hypothetical protein